MSDTTVNPIPPTVGNTANGIIVGADQPITYTTTTQTSPTPTSGPAMDRVFTAEDLEKARKQEKDKLYERLEAQKAEVAALQEKMSLLEKERQDRLAAEQAAQAEAEEAARKQAEEETDVRTLLEQKEQEWAIRLEAERMERESALAALDKEREYQALLDYRARRLDEERDEIIPQLIDFVTGNSPEEIEQSIAVLKERSASILDSAQQSLQTTRASMPGARVTAPSAGPLDNETGYQSLTPEQIRDMPMNEYAKHRQRLIGQAGQERRGLFG